jgi:DNA-directed RNA polymerase subunit RPC12/RpoP
MRSAKTSKRVSRKQPGSASKKSLNKNKKSSSGSQKKMGNDMARCMKCKKGVMPVDADKKTLPNGRCALTGKCPHCGTKVFKFCKC